MCDSRTHTRTHSSISPSIYGHRKVRRFSQRFQPLIKHTKELLCDAIELMVFCCVCEISIEKNEFHVIRSNNDHKYQPWNGWNNECMNVNVIQAELFDAQELLFDVGGKRLCDNEMISMCLMCGNQKWSSLKMVLEKWAHFLRETDVTRMNEQFSWKIILIGYFKNRELSR